MHFGNAVAQRIEELLREQLEELGVDVSALEPHEIAANMRCDIWPDQTLLYAWKEAPILRVVPERYDDGTVQWRMFTNDGKEQRGADEETVQ